MPTLSTCPFGHQYTEPDGVPAERAGLCPFCGTNPEIPRLSQRPANAETTNLQQGPTLDVRPAPRPSRPAEADTAAPQDRPTVLLRAPPTDAPDANDPPTVDLEANPRPVPTSSGEYRPLSHVTPPPGYELLDELGRGGMAVVYLARRLVDKQVVAIKMILSGPRASAADRERFRTEIATLKKMDHPQIVRVLDVGEFQGQLYLCMEYVSGGTLADYLRGVPQTPDFAARLVLTLARAIQAAHEHGIIHRDIKPGNVLVAGPDWSASSADMGRTTALLKIADFGVARQIDAENEGSVSAGIVGTPSYMAPEQAEGKRSAASPAADIYSLGAILYECLTGRPPFQGSTALETWQQVMRDEPIPPRRLNPRIPEALEIICLKCLERRPANRYQKAVELERDLERFLDNRPIRARRPTVGQKVWRWCGRHPGVTTGIAAVFVLLLVSGLVAGMFLYHQNLRLERLATERRQEEIYLADLIKSRNELKKHRDDLEEYRYAAKMHQAHQLWLQGDIRALEQVLSRYAESDTRHLRDFACRYLETLAAGSARELKGHHEDVYSLAWSPDGGTLASVGKDGTLRFWSATEPISIPIAAHSKEINAVAFAPNGRTVATGSDDGRIGLWDFPTGRLQAYLPSIDDDAIVALVFSADAKHLYAGTHSGRVHAWDVGMQVNSQLLTRAEGRVHQMTLSPEGRCLAIAGGSSVLLFDLVDKKGTVLKKRSNKPHTVTFSPAGNVVAVGTNQGAIVLYDRTTGKELRQVRGHIERVESVAFTPDGQLLLSGGGDGRLQLWDPETLQLLGHVRGHAGRIWCLAVSPDARWIASAGSEGIIKLSLPRLGKDYESLREDGPAITALATMPGAPLAVFGTHGGIDLQPLERPQSEPLLLRPTAHSVLSLAIAPDRRHLLYGCTSDEVFLDHVQPGKPKLLLKTQRADVPVAFSPDGSLAVTGDALGQIYCWDMTTGERTQDVIFVEGPVTALAFVPHQENLLAVGTGHGRMALWKVGTKTLRQTWLAHQFEVLRVVPSPDGKEIISTGRDRAVRRWSVVGGEEVGHGYLGHRDWVFDATFSPDGRNLATASRDGTVRVWCVETGLELLRLEQGGPVRGVAFVDANRLLVVGHDEAEKRGYARLYHARPDGDGSTVAAAEPPLSPP